MTKMGNCKTRVLILDDDADDIFIITEVLEEIPEGAYQVDSTNTIDQALAALDTDSYDIILCDFYLGAETGVDFIEKLKAKMIGVPVVLLTGLSSVDADKKAMFAGASDFLSKVDLQSSELDRTIRYAIANGHRQRLLSAVLSNVDVALCVCEANEPPRIWNEQFLELSRQRFSGKDNLDAISALLRETKGKSGQMEFLDRTFDLKIADLGKDRKLVSLQDITSHIMALRIREEAERDAENRALHCHFTGLPNRLALNLKLNDMVARGKPFFLINLDLNKFKDVNDLHGHDIGDALLVEVANRFQDQLKPNEYLARMGGDEFIALSPRQEKDDPTVCELTLRFEQVMQQPFKIEDKVMHIGASIGFASFPESANTARQLLTNADSAMYRAKNQGLIAIQQYDQTLDQMLRDRQRLKERLINAIQNDLIEVAFQPIYIASDNRITTFEALARWNDPDLGAVSPAVFISVAEESGMIGDLGRSILRKACQAALDWPDTISLAVNVSGVQIRHTDLVQDIQTVLFETGFPAKRLEIEITETVLLENLDQALHVLRGMKNLGVSLAMDDFGTGYSSLSSLVAFPFDKLKIDGSFVTGVHQSHTQAAIVRGCLSLANSLNLTVVAEGVESADEVAFLQNEADVLMQGYYFSRPVLDHAVVLDMVQTGQGCRIPKAGTAPTRAKMSQRQRRSA